MNTLNKAISFFFSSNITSIMIASCLPGAVAYEQPSRPGSPTPKSLAATLNTPSCRVDSFISLQHKYKPNALIYAHSLLSQHSSSPVSSEIDLEEIHELYPQDMLEKKEQPICTIAQHPTLVATPIKPTPCCSIQ